MQYFKQEQPKIQSNLKEKNISSKDHDNESHTNDDLIPSDKFVVRNLKWDIIFAEDIFFILKSFLPDNGSITKVEIYPSM